MFDDSHIYEAFEKLCQEAPHIADGNRPLNAGSEALLLIDESTNSIVTKVFYNNSSLPFPHTDASVNLLRELQTLRHLGGCDLADVQIPTLLSYHETLESSHFCGAYSMSKIEGIALGEYMGRDNEDVCLYEMGRVLARFHTVPANPFFTSTMTDISIRGSRVFDPQTNDLLLRADSLLNRYKRRVLLHGDFHENNMIVDEKGRITGIFDFTRTGYSRNHLLDLTDFSTRRLKHVIRGYNDADQHQLNQTLVELTCIPEFVLQAEAENSSLDARSRAEAFDAIHRILGDAQRELCMV